MLDPTDPLFHVIWLSASTVVTGALAVYGAHHREVQGARPFAWLMVSFALFSAFQLAGLMTHDDWWRYLLNDVRWTWTALLPLFWLLFALEYTGHDELTGRRGVTALGAIPAATVALVWTNDSHGLVWSRSDVVTVEGLAIMDLGFGPWFWVWSVFMYLAGAAGSLLLLRLVLTSEYLFTDQSALLVVGVVAPMVASVATTFQLTPNFDPPLDLAPYAFALTGVAFGYALFRHRLFDLVPATRQLGRNAAISQLEDGIVIVDTDRRIIYLNSSAAAVVDAEPTAVLGESIEDVVADVPVEFDVADALAEIDRGDRTYEVRSSPIEDRRDRHVGHTLVFHDVTERERRERVLVSQRDELEALNQLNAVIRGVNQALVSSSTHDDVLDAVCSRLAASDLYETAIAADVPTWCGDADRWTVRGSDPGFDDDDLPAPFDHGEVPTVFEPDSAADAPVTVDSDGSRRGRWTLVPIVYEQVIYGSLAIDTHRARVSDREAAVLLELGELIGHALDAVENRQLLSGESILEVELECGGDASPLAAVTERVDCRLELTGIVPSAGSNAVAYFVVEDAPVEVARDALETARDGSTRIIGDGAGHLEWKTSHEDLLGTLEADAVRIREVLTQRGRVRYTLDVAGEADVRALLDRILASFSGVRLVAKRRRERPIEPIARALDEGAIDMTDRQRESLEAAYRAGYFDWPRGSTAEEVADSLGISAPTFHGHLRKAQRSVIDELFGDEVGRPDERSR